MKPNVRFGIAKRRLEALDWQILDSIEVDEVLRDPEDSILTKVLPQIAFCDPQVEFCDQKGTAGLQKVFQLSQIILEKLVKKEEVLKEDRLAVELKCQALAEENSRHVRGMKRMSRRLKIANHELKKRQEMLVEVERKAQKKDSNSKNRFSKCPHCSKTFKTQSFLRAHVARRHSGSTTAQFANSPLPEFDDIKKILGMKEKFDDQWNSLTQNTSHLKTPKESLKCWDELEAIEKGLESQQAFWKSKLESIEYKPSERNKKPQSDLEWKTELVWKDIQWTQHEWDVGQWKEVNWTTWAFRSTH